MSQIEVRSVCKSRLTARNQSKSACKRIHDFLNLSVNTGKVALYCLIVASWNLGEPIVGKGSPAIVHFSLIVSLSHSKMIDDDSLIAGDTVEEARELF